MVGRRKNHHVTMLPRGTWLTWRSRARRARQGGCVLPAQEPLLRPGLLQPLAHAFPGQHSSVSGVCCEPTRTFLRSVPVCTLYGRSAMKISAPAFAAAFCMLPVAAPSAEREVSTPAEISAAAKVAEPGDTLVMADGVWRDADILFEGTGEEGRPITLRARTPGKVVWTPRDRNRRCPSTCASRCS